VTDLKLTEKQNTKIRCFWYHVNVLLKRKTTILQNSVVRSLKKIYNRVILDFRFEIKFQLSDELDIEWAGHPNWF
jgi:hypothetical protein